MKKILGTTLAAALLIPGPANAEILKNLKVGGSLDVQANSARNIRDFNTVNNDRIGDTLTRTTADLKWDLLDDVHATVGLRKNDRTWGQTAAGQAGTAQSASNPAGSQYIDGSGNSVLGRVAVDQANVAIDKLFGHVDATIGRQFYGDAGDLIIYFGPRDNYGLTSDPLDAVRVEAANDWMAFSGLAGTYVGTAQNPAAGTHTNTAIRGFNILWKNLPIKAHTYLWNAEAQGTGALGSSAGKNDNLYVFGVKLRGEAAGGWLNADLAANAGDCRAASGNCSTTSRGGNYRGKAIMLDGGYNAEISGVGALTPWLNFGLGTGRSDNFGHSNEGFTSILSDYRPGIMNRRFDGAIRSMTDHAGNAVNTNGLNNRVVWGLGVNMTPAAWEKLTVGAQLWDFRLQRNASNNANTTARVGNKHLGTEYGLTADWKHSENVKVGFGYARFMPGGAINEINRVNTTAGAPHGSSPASFLFSDLSVKF